MALALAYIRAPMMTPDRIRELMDLPGEPGRTRVVAAMSGGVDSAVAAALAARAGYDVVGITLQLYATGAQPQRKGACCAGEDIADARTAAAKIGIPHYVLDYEAKFRASVMEDFADAGGLPVITAELLRGGLLHEEALTVTGRTIAENVSGAQCWRPDVIKTLADPLQPIGSATAILRGNLCPDGAVIKVSAASPGLLRHRGRALVFDSIESYRQAADDDTLDVGPDDVLVLRYAGPRGYPGMPEVGNLPLPRRILAAGITDMVRISDARMSGTAYGTVVLHVAPEAAAGGPLALAKTGDMINLDVPARTLRLEVPDDELAARRAAWSAPPPAANRGWVSLYVDHVMQADRGCDLDFLVGGSGAAVPRPSH